MTTEEKLAFIKIVQAVHAAIVESGTAGIPAGHLYAALMPSGCTLAQYERIENLLIESGAVAKKNFLLTARIQPAGEQEKR